MRYSTGDNPLYAYRPPRLPLHPHLPPLPPITDVDLYKMVMTHISVQQLSRRSVMALQKPEEGSVRVWDYERLEHIGHGLPESIASTLIQDLYPWLRQGGAAIIRDHLVSNHSLAQISLMYELPSLFVANPSSIEAVQASGKIQASVLEAYIAGVFYNVLKSGSRESEILNSDQSGGNRPPPHTEPSAVPTIPEVKSATVPINVQRDSLPIGPTAGARSASTTLSTAQGEIGGTVTDIDDSPARLQPALQPTGKHRPSTLPTGGSHTADLEAMIGEMVLTSTTKAVESNIDRSGGADRRTITALRSMQAFAVGSGVAQGSSSQTESSLLDPFRAEFIPLSTPSLKPIPPSQPSRTLCTTARLSFSQQSASSTTKGQAYAHLNSWLVPLFTPFAEFLYACLLEEQERLETLLLLTPDPPRLEVPSEWAEEDRKAPAMVQALSQHPYVRAGGGKPLYEKFAERGKRWRVVSTVIDGNGKVWTGKGIRANGRAAKNIAAWRVYKAIGR